MLFSVALQLSEDYAVRVQYTLPFANHSEWFDVTADSKGNRQIYQFYNEKGEVIESHSTDSERSLYIRTEKDKQTCQRLDPEPAAIFPDLQQFTKLQDTRVDGRMMEHWVFKGEYAPETDVSGDAAYLATQTYQQDFFMVDGKPYRWEIHGRSNFDSHQDYYVLDYFNYTETVNETMFEPNQLCEGAVASVARPSNVMQMINLHQKASASGSLVHLGRLQALLARKNRTYTVSQNAFSGLSREDFMRLRTGLKRGVSADVVPSLPAKTLEIDEAFISRPSLDWRIKGAVGPVKDQVSCGSCWTFAAAGVLESRVNVLRAKDTPGAPLVQFSEQSILDCFWDVSRAPAENSQGCDGGSTDYALNWFAETKPGFAFLQDYMYVGHADWCKPERFTYKDYEAFEAWRVPPGSPEQLKMALQEGPVAVAVAVSEAFVFYSGGILNDPECGSTYADLGHAVILVGWGTDAEYGEYWILKNSWSNYWGQDGYIYVAIKDNVCGVTTDASYARVARAK